MKRTGILLSISSLPSPNGIGTFGKAGYSFCDFLVKAKQNAWQILPLSVTSYGDSPYQSPSGYAINPYFIDLDFLSRDGLLLEDEYKFTDFGDGESVDYGKLFERRKPILKKAVKRLGDSAEYFSFLSENQFWIEDYALFMTLKELNDYKEWSSWADEYKNRDKKAIEKLKKEQSELIDYYKKEQFLAFSQWQKLKNYAKEKGIEIIGDMPIYSAYDSHDVWAEPDNYLLDNEKKPILVAGVPPDDFTADGQLWGNPLYNWKKMKEDGFIWWKRKLMHQAKLYDTVRIDHFRGFEAFFAIPFGKKPKDGKWIKAPGEELFTFLKKEVDINIIAEDLGLITEEVRKLLRLCGFPNMRVLQFGFDGDLTHEYLPHNYPENCVAYTGTHDNNPTVAWLLECDERKREKVIDFAESRVHPTFGLIKKLFLSKADRVIILMQDYLLQGADKRMNFPGKEMGNWTYRITADVLENKAIIRTIRDLSNK